MRYINIHLKFSILCVISFMILLFFSFCSAEGDFVEMKEKISLSGIQAINPDTNELETYEDCNDVIISSLTPTFTWESIAGADTYELIISDPGRGKSYVYDAGSDTEYTVDDPELEYSYAENGELVPYIWVVRGKNNFQYYPSEICDFQIKNGVPPTVQINSPANDTTVSGATQIDICGYDDFSLDRIEISIDDGEWAEVWKAGKKEYPVLEKCASYSYDFTGISFGSHKICVRSIDLHENISEIDENDCINVIVLPPAPTQNEVDPCNPKATFSWVSAGEGVSYIFSIATDEACQNTLTDYKDIAVNDTTYTVTKDLSAGSYYWCIKSVYTDTTSETAYESEVVSSPFTIIILTAPTNLTISDNPDTDGNIVYNWDNNGQDIDGITIMLGTDGNYATSGNVNTYDAQAGGKTALTSGNYTWKVKVKKGNCESPWSTEATFVVNTCTPPVWDASPNSCYNNGGNVQISVKNGSANLKYNFQVKNAYSSWGTVQSGWLSNTSYQITPSSNIYGKIEYRVQYDDDPSAASSCEGTVTGTATFDYVIPPANGVVTIYDYISSTTFSYDSSTPDTEQIITQYFDDGNPSTDEPVASLEYDAYYGLLYNMEVKAERSGTIYRWPQLTGDTSFTDWELTPGIDIMSGWLDDSWWGWRVKSKAEGGDPTCESAWMNGINNFEGNADHDICYSDAQPVDQWGVSGSSLVFAWNPPNPKQHRIVLSPNNTWGDGDEIECSWATQNSNSIPLSSCPSLTSGSYFNIVVIETRVDSSSQCSVGYANYWPGYSGYTGIERVGANYYECHALIGGADRCDGS